MFTNSQHILLTPIEYLKGVGPTKAELLKKELEIHTFGDMLSTYPFRYVDRSSVLQIKDIQDDGMMVQLVGKITFTELVGDGRSKRLVSNLKDPSGMIELVWFQGIYSIEKLLAEGGNFLVYGKAVRFNGYWTITHPEIEKLESNSLDELPAFMPVYSSTEKLRTRWLSGRNYVKLVQQLFSQLREKDIDENLPKNLIDENNLMPRYQAIRNIHFPDNNLQLQSAIFRLKFEELFIHQIGICKLKLNRQFVHGYRFMKVGDQFNSFYKNHLPFELTEDQKEVLREIRLDTQTGKQMNRLLQGDVGSGKTIVALLCMLLAIDNDFQTCLMAPTEILAQQHYTGITDLLKNMDIGVGFLTGKVKAKDKRNVLAKLESGEIKILIGTHALIEDTVIFKNLGLCIIDEQHRFGVAQRAKLWAKNTLPPHILVMTATPIPRTLAMTSYGDLDVSVIKNLPPGRKPISTVHRPEIHRAKVMEFIRHEIDQGRQAYIVYPLIEESEKLDYENLLAGYEQVKQYFPDRLYNIAMVHGKQKPLERESNMESFVKGKAHIMVATTVIEVGVNVPNASVMLIESAERFGLSQLHQLRGRVGRGADKSYCILLTTNKISAVGKLRMHTMVTESSGFAIAEKDLELRGPGEIDGTRQSGGSELKLADIIKDVNLMEITRNLAIDLLKKDPLVESSENAGLKAFLMKRKDKEVWSRIS
ncbi:MAG TPA: ATP-dependent DNA helicase RecG [Chitinophagaceae bacterium]|nr:ATP-dependent DNA helicase RecG [Chitinophagaceae bacterium]